MEEAASSAFDYVSFLRNLGDFSRIPRHLKYRQRDYADFLRSTADYLTEFFYRRNPLADMDKVREGWGVQTDTRQRALLTVCALWRGGVFVQVEETVTKDFERLFGAGQLRGWEEATHKLACYCRATDHLLPTAQAFEAYQRVRPFPGGVLFFRSAFSTRRFFAALRLWRRARSTKRRSWISLSSRRRRKRRVRKIPSNTTKNWLRLSTASRPSKKCCRMP